MGAQEDGLEYGPLWKRFLAFVIDCVVLRIARFVISLPFTPFLILAGLHLINSDLALSAAIPLIIIDIALVATIGTVFLLYFVLAESSRYQATIGKYVFDLKVTDTGGRRISLRRALARTLGKLLTVATLGIGFITARFSHKRRTLHDRIASTYVVMGTAPSTADKHAPKDLLNEKTLKIAFVGAVFFLSFALAISVASLLAGYVLFSEDRLDLVPRPEKTEKEMSGASNGRERRSFEEMTVYVDYDTPPMLEEAGERNEKTLPWKRGEEVFPLRMVAIRPTLGEYKRGPVRSSELVLFTYINVDGSPDEVVLYACSRALRSHVPTAIRSTYSSKFEPAKKSNVPIAAWWSVVWRPISVNNEN